MKESSPTVKELHANRVKKEKEDALDMGKIVVRFETALSGEWQHRTIVTVNGSHAETFYTAYYDTARVRNQKMESCCEHGADEVTSNEIPEPIVLSRSTTLRDGWAAMNPKPKTEKGGAS